MKFTVKQNFQIRLLYVVIDVVNILTNNTLRNTFNEIYTTVVYTTSSTNIYLKNENLFLKHEVQQKKG